MPREMLEIEKGAPEIPRDSHVWLFIGKPKRGKTTAADAWVDVLLKRDPRAVALIHDPHGGNEAGKGYKGRSWPSIEAFARAPSWGGRRHVFRCADPLPLAPLAIQIGKRIPVVLVIDEMDRVIGPGGQFRDGGQGGPLYQIANEGRHLRVALVGTARRASRLGPDLPASAEGIFLMQLTGRADLDWCADVTEKAVAEAVRELPKYRGLLFDGDACVRRFSVKPGAIRWE